MGATAWKIRAVMVAVWHTPLLGPHSWVWRVAFASSLSFVVPWKVWVGS
jgi:hypothetical protein